MKFIYYLFLLPASYLPLGLLYGISNCIAFLNFYVIGYRRKIIRENLVHSFPNKSSKEIKAIEKQFYIHFADYLVETLKSVSISQKELDKRFLYENIELFDACKSENKNVIMLLGHVFNWEWFIGLSPHLPQKEKYAVYKRVRNKFWNQKIEEIRARFGNITISNKEVLREMMKKPENGESLFFFVADQSPFAKKITYSLEFLHQETPVFVGFDKVAMRKNFAVIYCDTKKIQRGKYRIHFKEIKPSDGKEFAEHEIVNQFFELLENTIQESPSNWLWSHKRWKYKKGIHY